MRITLTLVIPIATVPDFTNGFLLMKLKVYTPQQCSAVDKSLDHFRAGYTCNCIWDIIQDRRNGSINIEALFFNEMYVLFKKLYLHF